MYFASGSYNYDYTDLSKIKLYENTTTIPDIIKEKLYDKYLNDNLLNLLNYDIETMQNNLDCIMPIYEIQYNFIGYIAVVTNGDGTGLVYTNAPDYRNTDFIKYNNENFILTDCYAGESSAAIAFYNSNYECIGYINKISGNFTRDDFEIPANTEYLRFGTRMYNGETQIHNTKLYYYSKNSANNSVDTTTDNFDLSKYITKDYLFEENNVLDNSLITIFNGFPQVTNTLMANSNTTSIIFPVESNTYYYVYVSNRNRDYYIWSTENNFVAGDTYETLNPEIYTIYNNEYVLKLYAPETAKYLLLYIYNGIYDINDPNNTIIIMKDKWDESLIGDSSEKIKENFLPNASDNILKDISVLVFGDSITTAENFTINQDNETTAWVKYHPSNSYTDTNGNTVRYSKWPEILEYSEPIKELRNYAMSGASFKSQTRTSGYERQNLHYQIDLAINDIPNKHNAFPTEGDFYPDIIIFALGTNDGVPNDTYADAMNKTVYLEQYPNSIDVDATIDNLSENKFCEAARKAFLRIKRQFPLAQVYCSLPIQRSENEAPSDKLHDELKHIAERCGCIIIDNYSNSGIIREFNISGELGITLKDGLHPNEIGQNLMAREIISTIKSHYISLNRYGFNT